MKSINIKTFILVVSIISSITISCEKPEGEKDWGISMIYMPQSVGIYHVPNATRKNFTVDSISNTIKIHLGILRSGLQKSSTFSVDVAVNTEAINALINNGTLQNTLLMPVELYLFPNKVEAPGNKTEANFYLTVKKSNLVTFTGKKLAIGIQIKNPSKFELNNSQATTLVVLNVDDFLH